MPSGLRLSQDGAGVIGCCSAAMSCALCPCAPTQERARVAQVVPQAGRRRVLGRLVDPGAAAGARAASGQVPPAHPAVPGLQQGGEQDMHTTYHRNKAEQVFSAGGSW